MLTNELVRSAAVAGSVGWADAETKNNKGLHATEIGMFLCAHHEFILPAAVGDLQIGERYVVLYGSSGFGYSY